MKRLIVWFQLMNVNIGHPGSGKTVLATSVLDELDSGASSEDVRAPPLALYHFFQYHQESSRSPAAAFRSILSQILWKHRHNMNIVDKFAFVMSTRSRGQLDASEKTLVDLLHFCLDSTMVVVVDGVDECDDSDSLVKYLLQLSRTCSPKILLLSRINVPRLQSSVPQESRLPLPKSELSSDIRRYCEHEILELVDEDILPESALDEVDRLTGHMVHGADGMFLWARLMLQFLRSPALSQQKRMKTIKEINFPEGLEKMYHRIFLAINQSGPTTRKLVARIFTWLVYNSTAMTTRQIRQALAIDNLWTSGEREEQEIGEFETAAVMACRGLVELVPRRSASRISVLKFVHLTVKEILTRTDTAVLFDDMPSGIHLVQIPPPSVANLELGGCCLRQLLFHHPAQPLSGKFHQKAAAAKFIQDFPFSDYSAVHWMDHTVATITDGPVLSEDDEHLDKSFVKAFSEFAGVLEKFLGTPKTVTAWLEAYFTSPHDKPVSGSGLRKWASWVSELAQGTALRVNGALLGLVFEFRADLDRIVRVWGETLETSPSVVWDEGAAHGIVSSNLFYSPGTTRVAGRAPQKPDYPDLSDGPWKSISSISTDGSRLGVLSIWIGHMYVLVNHANKS